MKNYPSIKIFLLILIAFLIIGGAFVFSDYQNKNSQKNVPDYTYELISTSTKPIQISSKSQDTDGDGLMDWEEVLYGTDPSNPDTDGDGTSDGKEIKSGRNPTLKGPNDKLLPTQETKTKKLTETEVFARAFFAKYMNLRKSGLSGDVDSRDAAIQEVLQSGVLEAAKPKMYSEKDIKVSQNTGMVWAKKYGNDAGIIFKTKLPTKSRNEFIIIEDAINKDDPTIVKELDPIISSYKNIISALLKVEAPSDIAQYHLGLINSVSRILFIAESFRKYDTDPLPGLTAVGVSQSYIDQLSDSIKQIKSYLSGFGIKYENAEGGNFFLP